MRLEDSCCCSSLVLRKKQLPLLLLLDTAFFFSFFFIRQYSMLCYSPTFSLFLFSRSLSLIFSAIVEENNFSPRKKSNNTAFIETCQHVIKSIDCRVNYCLLYSKNNRTNVNKYRRVSPTHHIIFKYA
jgi:hypothetical protein